MNEDRATNEIVQDLKQLKPAKSEIDQRALFYQAGLRAGQAQQTASARMRWMPMVAAGLLAVIVAAPASYRIGHSSAMNTQRDAQVVVLEAEADPEAGVAEESTRSDPTQETKAVETKAVETEQRATLLASWIDPLHRFAESARMERETGTTLAVFHSSLVHRDDGKTNSGDVLFPSNTTGNRVWSARSIDSWNDPMPRQTLAVSDLRKLATSPEAAR